jgi:excisionase family DNA binding protein
MTQHNLQQRVTIPLPRPETDDLLDVATAADHLGTPVRFIRRLIAERRIRFYKIGRYVRIDRRDRKGGSTRSGRRGGDQRSGRRVVRLLATSFAALWSTAAATRRECSSVACWYRWAASGVEWPAICISVARVAPCSAADVRAE